MRQVVQFDWRRQWKRRVEPYLRLELVQAALDLGMGSYDRSWRRGDPPYLYGRPEANRVVPGKLTWYQPWGRCHWIAFFSMAVGVLNYPDLDWRFVSGELHTVPVGFDAADEPRVVMDILLFDRLTAEESIALARRAAIPRPPEAGDGWDEAFALFTGRIVPLLRDEARRVKRPA